MKQSIEETRFVATMTVADLKKTFSELLIENHLIPAPAPEQPQEDKLVKIENNNELVPRKKMAILHNCTVATIDKWSKVGILPRPIKKGGLVYYRLSDLNRTENGRPKLNQSIDFAPIRKTKKAKN
jgi:hypothetical protein